MLRRVLRRFAIGIQIGCGVYLTTRYFFAITLCEGRSMEPTIKHHDVVAVKRFSIQPKKGDVVVSKSPRSSKDYVCKRIAAITGDAMPCKPRERMHYFDRHYIPKGYMWLEGDNKVSSVDSRTYGPIPQGLLAGKVVYRVWPLSRLGAVK
ncbi:mitochondrial inner membrane protease subunit 1-like isoform X2 [Oscarella lobularis]|uniref:mitochondrial inner membrane protease subunit 1-like isoform X2 n=1 Tax=Oscarella lobularis TaxID=121494 RepID=UPI0033137DC5